MTPNPPHLFLFSACCHDFDPLGGFNPNTFATPNTFVAPNTFTDGDLHMLAGSPELRGTLYSGGGPPPLPGCQQFAERNNAQAPFDAMPGNAILEDMIIDGTNGQSSFTQQKAKAYAEDEEEGNNFGWENGVYTFTEASVEIITDPKGKKKKGVTAAGMDPKKKVSGRGPKWSSGGQVPRRGMEDDEYRSLHQRQSECGVL
jgi:hypothetical protein